jgi:DNA sulfur modification protein DndC
LREIRRIWREEKHEFDDALPRIYREVIGEIFPDSHPNLDRNTLGSDEWNLLAELCQDDPMHLELMAKLLDTERQFQSSSRRVGIFEALEKCFDTSSRPKQQAIDEAHLDRDLKQAHQEGDAKAVREAIDKLKNQPQQPPAMPLVYKAVVPYAVAPSDTETAQPASSWAELKFGKKREAL